VVNYVNRVAKLRAATHSAVLGCPRVLSRESRLLPDDKSRAAEYEAGPYAGFAEQVLKGFASIVPPDADVSAVAEAIVKVVEAPFGKRPFRVHIDPTQDGAEVVNAVSDRVRAELLRRIGLADLLSPRILAPQSDSDPFPKQL
jgi:hypothetical protein